MHASGTRREATRTVEVRLGFIIVVARRKRAVLWKNREEAR
jgi:hypothetical protein